MTMKKLAKILLTLILAVAFVLPMTAVVYADDEYDSLTSSDQFINVNESKKYVTFSGASLPMTVSALKSKFVQNDNDVRKIVMYSSENVKYENDNDVIKTGDIIRIENADGGQIKEYRFIIKGDVNSDGLVNTGDYAKVVEYQKGTAELDSYQSAALTTANDVEISVGGDDNMATGAGDYNATVSFGAKSSSTSVSYIEFTLQYPTFFVYSDYSTPSDMSGWTVTVNDLGNYKLKITAYKEDFAGALFDNSSTPKKKIVNLEFTLISTTNEGTTGQFKILSGAKGVSNNGGTFSADGSNKTITVGSSTPTEPTLKSKTESSITLNSVVGYQYYCSTSNTAPSSTATGWTTASGTTVTFSGLNPGTDHYIFYRRSATDGPYLMDGSIKTDNPAALAGPDIETSDKTSITVSFGSNFKYIYISQNSTKPSSNDRWISLSSVNGTISDVGPYKVNKIESTVKFEDLKVRLYYIFGKTESDVISEPTVWSPTPSFAEDDISTTENTISLPFAAIYEYSIDGITYVSAKTKANMTPNGSIYIQREMVDGKDIAVIHELEAQREYTVYVKVYSTTGPASEPCELTIKTVNTRPATPPAIQIRGRNQIYIAVEYNKQLQYRINNSSWTYGFDSAYYPTENNMVTLGDFAYYFSDSTNPTFIVFTRLTPDTSYTIDAKYADDPTNTTNISTTSTKTLVCNHVYGQKVYQEGTLNYTQTCAICGDVKKGTDTPAHTHTYETVTVPSTCTTHGYTQTACKECHAVLDGSRVELPLAPHTEARRIAKQATCTENGTAEIYCSVCGILIRTETIYATGHRYEIVTSTVQPTCTSKGYEIILQRCASCGDEKEVSRQEIAALGHNAEWVTAVEPTASTEGRKDYVCSRCGEVLETEVIPKLINYIKNANGTGTYEITVTEEKALVTDAAKLAIADGDASVRVVFSNGTSVELDPAMTVAFLRNNSYINVKKLTSDADASGDLAKAGFSSTTNAVYEITAENAIIANGKATVTINYDASAEGGAVNVYFVDAQGKKTKLNSTYSGGKLTFETTHFSTYVIEQGKAKGSNTGLIIAIIAIVAVVIATGGTFGYMVYTSKKTKKRKFNF